MYFRILEVNDKNHCMTVRYWTDKLSEDSLASHFDNNGKIIRDKKGNPVRCRTDFNITFYDHLNPSVEDIENEIRRNAPVRWLKLLEDIEDPYIKTSLENINKFMNENHELNFN